MWRLSLILLLIITSWSWLAWNLPALAVRVTTSVESVEASSPNPPSTAPTASDIATEKVGQFIQAYLQVLQLLEQREGALQGAETQLEAQQLEQEIEAEAQKLIEKAGLTRQEYVQLLSLANIDPEFGERLAIQLQEAD
jgi:hypothetical protein